MPLVPDRTLLVPAEPYELTLSSYDRRFGPMPSRRILFFSLPPAADKEQLIELFHEAFVLTIRKFPFLAADVGRQPFEKGGREWLRDLLPGGAARLEVKELSDKLDYAVLRKANFSQALLDSDLLCPLPHISYGREVKVDACRFRVNFVQGGVMLVVQILHTVCDGMGITEVIRTFAENCRALQKDRQAAMSAPVPFYSFDRAAYMTGKGAHGSLERHTAWESIKPDQQGSFRLPDAVSVSRTFHLSIDALEELKRSVGPDAGVSQHDLISALMWQSIMRARLARGSLASADGVVHLAQPIDFRSRLGLPMPWMGNAISIARASLPVQELCDPDKGLLTAARAIRAELKMETEEKIRDMLAYQSRIMNELSTRLCFLQTLATQDIFMTSYFKLPIHEIDFGPALGGGVDEHGHALPTGRIEAFRLPSRGLTEGVPIVFPRLPDGSCELMLNEREDVFKAMMEGSLWGRLAREKC